MFKANRPFVLLAVLCAYAPSLLFSQVELRDSTIHWMQHSFRLNADYSMDFYSTADNYLHQAEFHAKVLENEFIRLVVIPEYGARVISFVYKPTGHEYLYQSACGSPYGINEGNFYYNWLMVYGGIFPTFPEPEHGKTWLLEWEYEVVKNTGDSLVLAMEYTDNNSFSKAPGKFNNGITNITCRVEIGVYAGSSRWDFDVSLKNNRNEKVRYEYWTCTTLTPGSAIGDTGSPLQTELVAPIAQYRADWSPGNWIGNYGRLYDFSRINFLSKWTDMGIAYGVDLHDNYWGVINQENREGIFRISENRLTPGLKFWTWGKNNVDNDLFDFSNGGADNYIELWAGVSESFFSDASLEANEEIHWKESYAPTVGLRSILKIDPNFAVNLEWEKETNTISYQFNAFQPDQSLDISMYLTGDGYHDLLRKSLGNSLLGFRDSLVVSGVPAGTYSLNFEVFDEDGSRQFVASRELISLGASSIHLIPKGEKSGHPFIQQLQTDEFRLVMPEADTYQIRIFNLNGQLVRSERFTGKVKDLSFHSKGLFLIQISGFQKMYDAKILVR